MTRTRPDTRLQHRHAYESAVGFIAVNHAKPLILADLARHTMTSTRQLQRILLEEGTSFRELVLRARMEHARELLQTEMPIGAIARAVGYMEAAQFSKAFRCHFGCTPSAWRKRRRVATPRSAPPPAVRLAA